MVKISIVTVVFNDQENILKTIKSVTNQNFKDREYLVIDGGSTDNTKEIINQNISSIDKYISEKDKGIYDAMNKGIGLAHGDWIIFQNCGDVILSIPFEAIKTADTGVMAICVLYPKNDVSAVL